LDKTERKAVRELLIVDAAVMMHGYASLIHEFNDATAITGIRNATTQWRSKLKPLAASHQYSLGTWSGDLFEKRNPLWQKVGVVKPGKDGSRLTVLNTGGARSECGRVLRQLLSMDKATSNLTFLTKR